MYLPILKTFQGYYVFFFYELKAIFKIPLYQVLNDCDFVAIIILY